MSIIWNYIVRLRLLKRKVATDPSDESERKRVREMKEWQEEQEERADRIFHR